MRRYIERISPDNPLTERHAGMMAVLRNGSVCGPVVFENKFFSFCDERLDWQENGFASKWGEGGADIIAVMPMPDLSGLEGECDAHGS